MKNSTSRIPPSPISEILVHAQPGLCPRAREHRAHLVDDAGVDGAAPDEWRERAEEPLAERRVPGDGARADQRGALPGPAPRLVVALRGRQRVHQRPARALGPEPQVHAPGDAVVGRLVEGGDEPLRDPREVLVQRVGPAGGRRGDDEAVVRLVEEHQVDVAARVELATAELAHADDRERTRGPVRGDGGPEATLGPGLRLGERDLAADIGEIGQLSRRDVDVMAGMGQELAGGDAQLLPSRPATQTAAHPHAVRQVPDGAGCEAAVGPEVAGLPRTPRQGEQILRVRVDERSEGRVAADQQGPQLHEISPDAVARGGDEGSDARPGGRSFAGGHVLGAHRMRPA